MKLSINILKEPADFVAECKKKEEEFELNGIFNQDANENSMDNAEPVTEDYPYIKKGFKKWVKHWFYLNCVRIYSHLINKNLTNLKVVNNKNAKKVKGAVVTCNHISLVDSFAIRKAIGADFYYVAAEFNNFKGHLGTLARHSGYIPLPEGLNKVKLRKFNDAISYYLNKGKKVLIYPEQSMWRDYKKPRPLKNGAFRYAVQNHVPIQPLFITIKEKDINVDENGLKNYGDYTIHVLDPIYPKPELNVKENIDYLRQENYRVWKETYEKTYGIPLEYTTIDKSKIEI